nr:hypothetical protein [Ardenticatena sp.]
MQRFTSLSVGRLLLGITFALFVLIPTTSVSADSGVPINNVVSEPTEVEKPFQNSVQIKGIMELKQDIASRTGIPVNDLELTLVGDPRSEALVESQAIFVSKSRDEDTPQGICLGKKFLDVVAVIEQREFVTMVSGRGPAVLGLNYTATVKNSFTSNAGISANFASASLGFNVDWSSSFTYLYQIQIPSGKTGYIVAYNKFAVYVFDVFCDPWGPAEPYKMGDGVAKRFIGVDYVPIWK